MLTLLLFLLCESRCNHLDTEARADTIYLIKESPSNFKQAEQGIWGHFGSAVEEQITALH